MDSQHLGGDFPCATAPRRNSLHWTQGTTTWAEICGWVDSPASTKEAGNYLLGTLRPTTIVHEVGKKPCTQLHRRKDAVVSRSALTLDVDTPRPEFADAVGLAFPYAALGHSTFSSSPDHEKWRLLVPTDREMAPDEYTAACTTVMRMFGSDQFDPSTAEPWRYMFRPAAQQPEWFRSFILDGPLASVERLLEGWERDLSAVPLPAPHRAKRDPFELAGVVGAFNRAYEDWDLLIKVYELPYEPAGADRYQLVGAVSQAGMGPIPGVHGLVYSHHSNDPAYGQACSAFDLVRLHRYDHLDEGLDPKVPVNRAPSQAAMLDLAAGDHRVTAELVGVDFDSVLEENDWKLRLRLVPRTGKFIDCIGNWDLITQHDPVFGLLRFNELTGISEFTDKPPWKKRWRPAAPQVTANDRWEMIHYVEREFGIRANYRYLSALVDTTANVRAFHPIRDYLAGLVWDGTPRVETCLPGVRPTAYTRMVARKVMTAAVARMFVPGCKWDHEPVLVGREGIGKTWWVERMARGNSATLGRIDNKDTLLVLHRNWIILADESHSMRKNDHDSQKEFLTRRSDVFRLPYAPETLAYPRQFVIWSTTNDETFLRRQEGNRRFLTVHCEDPVDFELMTDEYVDQIWAEAVYMYRAGERLYLDQPESVTASEARERHVEEDVLGGLVTRYLDTLVPADWEERSPEARQLWLADRAAGFVPVGDTRLDRTCTAQVWVEALGQRPGDHRRNDLLDITNVLLRLPGWRSAGVQRVSGYGPQKVYVRDDLL